MYVCMYAHISISETPLKIKFGFILNRKKKPIVFLGQQKKKNSKQVKTTLRHKSFFYKNNKTDTHWKWNDFIISSFEFFFFLVSKRKRNKKKIQATARVSQYAIK